jgi:hypothetical protein
MRGKIESLFSMKSLAIEQRQLRRTAFARSIPAKSFRRKQEMQTLDLGGSEVGQFLGDFERPRKCLSFGSLRPKLLNGCFRAGG